MRERRPISFKLDRSAVRFKPLSLPFPHSVSSSPSYLTRTSSIPQSTRSLFSARNSPPVRLFTVGQQLRANNALTLSLSSLSPNFLPLPSTRRWWNQTHAHRIARVV
jgi:hypothetical protein